MHAEIAFMVLVSNSSVLNVMANIICILSRPSSALIKVVERLEVAFFSSHICNSHVLA